MRLDFLFLFCLPSAALSFMSCTHPFAIYARSSSNAKRPSSCHFATPKLGVSSDVDTTSTSPQPPILDNKSSTLILFFVLPLLSLSLPLLLAVKQYAVLAISKRVYIYAVATSILLIGSSRGANDSANLGQRLQALTAELLPSKDALLDDSNNSVPEDDARFEELRALDVVTPTAQSAALPVLVVGSLALSVLLLQLQNLEDLSVVSDMGSSEGFASYIFAAFRSLSESFRSTIPALVQLSNVAVIGLFVRGEVDRGVKAWFNPENDESIGDFDSESASESLSPSQFVLPISALLVASAYFGPPSIAWPVRNLVCSALGIGVVRALQVPRLWPVVGALLLLVCYDVYSVFIMLVDLGTQSLASSGAGALEGAANTMTTTATDGAISTSTANNAASSAMGAVAMSKIGSLDSTSSSLWQPGLLEIRLKGRVTDLLGLGDAVFPSLLSTIALRYDQSAENNARIPRYFLASITGYGLGCIACEFAPGIGSSGLPALLFIVPVMLLSTLGTSVLQGELGTFFTFSPAASDGADQSV